MKKLVLLSFAAMLSLSFFPSEAKANISIRKTEVAIDSAAWKAALVSRLTEIKDMDKSSLNRAEKQALREEKKDIKKTLTAAGGIYLSLGAVIIIIILLIILL